MSAALDFSETAPHLVALAYMKAARSYGIPAALEVSQSGRGAHVWIFFAHAISASVARSVVTSLLSGLLPGSARRPTPAPVEDEGPADELAEYRVRWGLAQPT